jgi:hypothetical protein
VEGPSDGDGRDGAEGSYEGVGYPPLPGCKTYPFSSLAMAMLCKFVQTKGLQLNMSSKRGYGRFLCENDESPGFPGLSLTTDLIIADWAGEIRQLDPALFHGVKRIWGLTRDFWAKF